MAEFRHSFVQTARGHWVNLAHVVEITYGSFTPTGGEKMEHVRLTDIFGNQYTVQGCDENLNLLIDRTRHLW